MPYISINDFKLGMDRRRPRYAGPQGSLWSLKNGHYSRGGDIERAKKFVSFATLPAGTFGLAQVGGRLHVFGSADLAATTPAGVQYLRLTSGALSMTALLEARPVDGQFYTISQWSDGTIRHFYGSTEITDWNTLAASNSSFASLAGYLADQLGADSAIEAVATNSTVLLTARVPGTAFTTSVSATNNGSVNDQTITATTLQANVPAVPEVRATATIQVLGGSEAPGTNRITSVLAGATELLSGPVDYTTNNITTASILAGTINAASGTHGYGAAAVGDTVTISAPVGQGTTANGRSQTVAAAGGVSVSASATYTGGVTAAAAIAQVVRVSFGGTYEAADEFTITVNSVAYKARGSASGSGTSAFIYKSRVYSPANTLYRYSAVNAFSDFTSGTSGFINFASESDGSERLLCSATYNQSVAIFARRNVYIWDISATAADNAYRETLNDTGTVAARSVLGYGNTDVFYLSDAGIRSIRARDVTNAAFADDIGTSIDPYVREHITTLSRAVVRRAVAVTEPVDGRYMLALGDRIYVLSYFPRSKVSGWSWYEPGFTVSDFAVSRDQLYARAGDTIYIYGGLTGLVYPSSGEAPVVAQLPFLHAGTMATVKKFTGIDIAAQNEWKVSLLVDPNDDTKAVEAGRITEVTQSGPHIRMVGSGAMFALNLECSRAGAASISSIQVHYDPMKEEAR